MNLIEISMNHPCITIIKTITSLLHSFLDGHVHLLLFDHFAQVEEARVHHSTVLLDALFYVVL